MAAMSTALTEFNDGLDSRTYVLNDHTVLKPRIVIQKRRVPQGSQTISETSIAVISATEDSEGAVIPQKVSFSVTVRTPINGDAQDVTDMLAVFRDIIAGDEFGVSVTTQKYLV